jgi:4-hydroxy-3-methylbut-2-en-1-yl diphosphate reductase
MGSFRRTSFGLKQVVRPRIEQAFASLLVDHIRVHDGTLDLGHLSIRLPISFGLCHGVERAIQLAFETRQRFPEARLFLTDEIVHNPAVNGRLRALGYRYLGGRYADGTSVQELCPDDVVLLPAFGVETPLLDALQTRGVQMVDAVCGEVMLVWKRVREYAREGYTTVIHGAPRHQETRATVSRTQHDDPFLRHVIETPAAWIVVRDLEDAQQLADHVLGRTDAATVAARFDGCTSPGFRAERDLERIGIANQTTMLARETLAVQGVLRRAYVQRYGEAEATARVHLADTVCSATQDRQDALSELLAQPLDLLLVVGGYNSANTGHLLELAQSHGLPAFHVEGAECLASRDCIRHWSKALQQEVQSCDWWPQRPRPTIGVAAGASTPDTRIGELVVRAAQLAGCSTTQLQFLMSPPASSSMPVVVH